MDLIRNRVEQSLGRELAPEEFAEIQIWDRGKRLASVVNYEGWNDVVEMLKGYVEKADRELREIPPWKKEEASVAHAILFAANEVVTTFLRDVQMAIQAERPAALEEAVRR